MTRCSYIPPEGQSVIASAKERGGTTDGDIRALVDRFGCKAEAQWVVDDGNEGRGDRPRLACTKHVGPLLSEWINDVRPYEPAMAGEAPRSIEVTVSGGDVKPPDRMVFVPIVVSPQTVGVVRPVVDRALTHGDLVLWSGVVRRTSAGCSNRDAGPSPRIPYSGEEIAGMVGCLAPAHIARACEMMVSLPSDPPLPANAPCGAPTVGSNGLYRYCKRHMRLAADAGATTLTYDDARASSVELQPANRPTDGNTTCPAAFGGSMHTYTPGAERCFCGKYAPPPYAVGDEVEWRTRPLDTSWHAGRVTSIVDDRPNDGVDKPFWIVRVDTAGERRFAGPAAAVCLRRLGVTGTVSF